MYRAGLAAVVLAAFALGGCSAKVETNTKPTIPEAEVESSVADALQRSVGKRPDDVDCPGPVEATPGQTARCTLSSGSTRYGLTVTIKSYNNGKAQYDVQVDQKPMS